MRLKRSLCYARRSFALSGASFGGFLFAVARVLGNFSPRKFPSFVALAVKGFTVCFVLKRTLLPQSSFIARREIPQTLRV